MKVRLARTAGYCMGVTRAMNMALRAAAGGAPAPIVTLGPLIHNRQAVEDLAARGIEAVEEMDRIESGTVIIRAHGVTRETRSRLASRGVNIIDATCPNVLSNQRSIARWTARGYSAIVVGDMSHAEITGLLGHAERPVAGAVDGGGYRDPVVVASVGDLARLELPGKVVVIAQTTFSGAAYAAIVAAIRAQRPGAEVIDSICSSTADRQAEMAELAAQTDAVVVVGGRHSANTVRLAEIGRGAGTLVLHVETAKELREEDFRGVRTVGVSAGASTPSSIIEEVAARLSRMGESREGEPDR